MVTTYRFLSTEWIVAVREIHNQYRDQISPTTIPDIRINQIITETPFEPSEIKAHLDTTLGFIDLELGHLENPDVTVSLDYETALAIFVNGDTQFAMQAFMAGKIRVDGDMAKLMSFFALSQSYDQDSLGVVGQVAQKVKDITE